METMHFAFCTQCILRMTCSHVWRSDTGVGVLLLHGISFVRRSALSTQQWKLLSTFV